MANLEDFFSSKNRVDDLSEESKLQPSDYLEAIAAFSRTTYESIYVIDYQKKGFEYVSENPLFLCGHTAEEVKEMGYVFYFKYVIEPDLNLLVKINTVGFDFYENIPLEERKYYTISYDFHIRNQEKNVILINQKLTPLFLTKNGKIWKALCIVSLSGEREAGNIRIFKQGDNKTFSYSIEGGFWKEDKKIKLSERQKEILQLSTKGYTINEIAESIFVSSDTVKFHRRKLFDLLEVANMSEAIMFATNNKLI